MKRYKKIIILGGVLAVAIIAAVIISLVNEHKEKINSTVETVLTIDPENVTAISWNCETSDMDFSKDASTQKWVWQEDGEFPVSEDKIKELAGLFSEFQTDFTIEDVEDYSQYGLDNPACTINITEGDNEYTITFGDYSSMDEKRYMSIGDGNVYLASTDPTESFALTEADMIQNDELPVIETAQSIQVEADENYLVYKDETSGQSICVDDIYFTERDGKTKNLDTEKVDALLGCIGSVDESNYVTYKATQDDLAACGLDNPTYTITVKYQPEEGESEETFVISMNRSADGEAAVEVAAEEETTDEETLDYVGYVRIGDSPIIYQISGEDYEELSKADYNDLRHDQIFIADFDFIDSIDVILDSEKYEFKWDAYKGDDGVTREMFYKDEVVDSSNLKSTLEAIRVQEFTTEKTKGQEEIRLTFNLDNEDFPQLEIVLYRYDGDYCIAKVDGEVLGLVNRSEVVDLIEAVNAIVLE